MNLRSIRVRGPLSSPLTSRRKLGLTVADRRTSWFAPRLALQLVLCVVMLGLTGSRAEAACTPNPDPLADNGAVVCDGNDSTGFDASGATGLTITTSGDTSLDDSGALDSALIVSDDNTVTLGTDEANPPAVVVTVTEANGFGVRGGNDNTITNHGTIDVLGAGGVGIDVGDQNSVTLDAGSFVNVTGANGIGLRGNDNNFVTNAGEITVNAIGGRAMSIGNNTTGVLPNGAVATSTSTIDLAGEGSIGIETGTGAGVANSGNINATGNNTRAISVGSRIDNRIQANLTHQTNTITVSGNDSFGIKAGDGWIDGRFEDTDNNPVTPDEFIPEAGGIRHGSGGSILVSGTNSVGIFAGDEATTNGEHDSFVLNGGTISVTGVDAIGVSVGGNTFLGRLDLEGSLSGELFTFDNRFGAAGRITGGADAGPLVDIRNFVSGNENRVYNRTGAEILADLTNGNQAGRGIAIQGTGGDELILNEGTIRGHIELGAGNDRYFHGRAATYEGQIRGGAGIDEAILVTGSFTTVPVFDLGQLENFETLSLRGNGSWQIENGQGFTGTTDVGAGILLEVPAPLILGGDLNLDPDSGVRVTLVDTSVPLTVEGDATFDGTLFLLRDPALRTPGTYRLIQVNGIRTNEFATEDLQSSEGLFTVVTSYDADGLLLTLDLGTFASVAQGANRSAIGQHLDDILLDGTGDPALDAQINEIAGSSGNVNTVFDALSPEGYDAQTSIVVESGRRVTNLLLDRPRECDSERLDPWRGTTEPLPCHASKWSPWLAAIGSFRSRDGFAGRPNYDANLGGAAFGIDVRPIGGLDLTLAVSSQRGKINVASTGDSTLTMTDLSANAAYTLGPLRAQTVFTWGHTFHKSRRHIQFQESTTPVNVTAEDDFESDRFTLAGEIGLLFSVGPIDLEPIGGIDWNWVEQDDVRESGAGGFGLAIDQRDDEVGSVNGGLRISSVYHHQHYLIQQLTWMEGLWRPTLDVRWRQNLKGYDRTLDARLIGSPDTVSGFRIEGKEDKGGFEIGAGLSFVPDQANRLQFDVRYEAYRSSHTLDHELVGRVVLGF